MLDFNTASAPSNQSPVPPALADLLEVASMETPDGQPTVAAQYAAKAQQSMMPQMPQGQGMPPDQGMQMPPSVQDIAQNAEIGDQIQTQQEQAQQQEMMQAMEQILGQQQAQQNAMRFGVAAAPGANTVQMAEGGIVGYAGAGTASSFDPSSVDEARELLRKREEAQAKLRAAEATRGGGVGSAPSARAGSIRSGLGVAALLPMLASEEGRRQLYDTMSMMTPGGVSPATLMGVLGQAVTSPSSAAQPPSPGGQDLPQASYSNEGRNYPVPIVRGGIEGDLRGLADDGRDRAGPPAGGGGLGGLRVPSVDYSRSDSAMDAARAALEGYEVEGIKPEAIAQGVRERRQALDPLLREMGVNPDQYKEDLQKSEDRKARRLEGIAALEKQSLENRSGVNRMIEFLSKGSGRFLPGGFGEAHTNMLARDLAENTRFLNAREQVMQAEDEQQEAIRKAQRAEALNNIKGVEDALQSDRNARNKKRDALITMQTEFAKTFDSRVHKLLDASITVQVENLRAAVQRESTSATREATAEGRRQSRLIELQKIGEAGLRSIDMNFRKRFEQVNMLPEKDRAPARAALEAERDLAVAHLDQRISRTRQEIFGGGSGGITVERIK